MNPRRPKAWVAWLLGIAGCALLLILALRVSWHEVVATLKEAALPWLGAMLLLSALSVSLRALRLTRILGTRARYLQVWRAVALGYFGSLFLPLGGGELVKVAAIRKEAEITFARAGTALAMDRLFDLSALVALIAALLAQRTLPGMRPGPLAFLSAVAIGLGTLFMLLVISGHSIKARLTAWAAHHPGRHPWITRFDEIHDQAAAPLRRGALSLAGLCALQALIFLVDIVCTGSGLLAFPFGHGLPASASIRLATFVMVGFGLPLLPGGFGSHQVASILALAPYGIVTSQALALSLAGEVIHVVTLATLGMIAIFSGGSGLFGLLRHRGMLNSYDSPEPS